MGRPRIYTEEELKQRKREYAAKWRAENPDYDAKRYQKNRDKILEQNAKWRAKHPDYDAKWRAENPDYYAKLYQENKEEKAEYQAEYNKTPMGRANYIVNRYRQSDKKYNRGECTLTARWVVDNIFSKPCHYCGAIGWDVIGCDRIDNLLPHTPENVVPCCRECNLKRHLKSYEEFKKDKL